MAGAFGFPKFPQRPTPASQDVGMALLQRGQQQHAPASMPPMMAGPDAGAPAPSDPDAAVRAAGAQKMGGPGQIDDNAADHDGTHSANAVNVAVGEALTRLGSGYSTNSNPFKDRARHIQNLQQLGLSAIEAELLSRTGGV